MTWITLEKLLQAKKREQQIVVTYYGEAESAQGDRVSACQVVAETPLPLEQYVLNLVADCE